MGLWEVKKHGGGLLGGQERWSSNCDIRYYTVDGAAFRQLAVIDRQLLIDPFAKAMALLGAAGWELVAIQHGNAHGGQIANFGYSLLWNNKVAYFKRPVIAGRAVNEPELVI